MKKLQVPYNLDPEVLSLYAAWSDYIAEIYFAPHPNLFPTARQFEFGTEEDYFKEIENICAFGDQYNINTMLLLNGTNIVLNNSKLNEIDVFLKKICNKITGVIIANPILAEWVHSHYPQLKIRLSVLSLATTVGQIKQIANLGYIKEICLPQSYNRDLNALKELKKEVPNIEFSAIVNSGCRANCPLFNWHHSSFNSNLESWNKGNFSELKQSLYKQSSNYNNNILASPFILPSELFRYDEFYHQFKLEDRTISTSNLHSILASYATRIDKGTFLIEFLHGSCLPTQLNTLETDKLSLEWKTKILTCKNECWKCNLCDKLLKNMLSERNIENGK